MLSWDADAYDRHAVPHVRWGRQTLGRLRLSGTETVLDFGCGTGRDVELLLDVLPHGRVIAVDGSPAMLARLRQRLADRLARVEVVQADLRQPLPVATPVDAVMSVATLHWLPDHKTVFSHIATVLRSGGRFAAEAGGAGNLAAVLAAVARARPDLRHVTEPARSRRTFAGVAETVRNLALAGFGDIDVDLVADPMAVPIDMFESLVAFAAPVDLGHRVVIGDQLTTLSPRCPAHAGW
ncbi:MAG: class I SAM-dependent methyltransferase [Micromonosporaceae bacterium]|nr:class I SAM-dependent methyltransferase [Micromonosporaceae bacterium]